MIHELKESIEIDRYTGEKVKLLKKKCICGHSMTFLSQNPALCRHCGRMVYPTKFSEFKDKLIRERRKSKYE